jgi:UMF1 family MFS transporter
VWAWAFYDFANSAFTTLVVTFIYAVFFTEVIAGDTIKGSALWSRGVAITAIVVALASPVLGAFADRGGLRKLFLLVATVVCVLSTSVLYTIPPGKAGLAITWFVIANIAYEMGIVFYNAFLPDIAPAGRIGRVSGFGWALGYVGGLVALVIALVALVGPEVPLFGFSVEAGQNIRATNLLVAIWFAVFSAPLFLFVREDRSRASRSRGLVGQSIRQLVATFREIRRYRQIVRFLVARLLYNDGLITVFAFGAVYAAGTFGFDMRQILFFGIVLNVTAGLGAFTLGFLDDRLGGKRTVIITLFGLIGSTLLAILAPSAGWLWVAGVLIGIFVGPNQSASRSLMGRFVPPEKENEFFGFFAFSGKATAFLGPLLFGVLTTAFGSQRAGISAVLALFALGLLVLWKVDEADGIATAAR